MLICLYQSGSEDFWSGYLGGGLAFSIIYVKERRISLSILVHMLGNSLSFIILISIGNNDENANDTEKSWEILPSFICYRRRRMTSLHLHGRGLQGDNSSWSCVSDIQIIDQSKGCICQYPIIASYSRHSFTIGFPTKSPLMTSNVPVSLQNLFVQSMDGEFFTYSLESFLFSQVSQDHLCSGFSVQSHPGLSKMCEIQRYASSHLSSS